MGTARLITAIPHLAMSWRVKLHSLGVFTSGKSPRHHLHRWQSGFENCFGQSRAKKQGLSLPGIELCHLARSQLLHYSYKFWKNVQ